MAASRVVGALHFGGNGAAASPISKSLHIMLMIVLTVLTISGLALTLVGLLMLAPSDLRNGLLSTVDDKGALPTPQLIALNCFAFALMSAAYIWVTLILRKIVKTLMSGDPFVPENISRLRRMWIILAVTEVFQMMVHAFIIQGEDGMIKIRLAAWFMVFVIAALSEVFRHGTELRQEQEFTV